MAATIGLVVTDLKRVIAYSTMSQIGYMIMAVSSAAYAAGMFHLMTHAFFKALLFMAAGSVISAMGGNQDLDRMSGFRKVMPFTYGCMVIGGLALSGIPPFSGFFSKDEILSLEFERGGWHTILGVVGYLGAFMTAIYTFRMIFRAFHGEQCPEAEELAHGHLYHAPEPTNPATGEVEDTEVGFPGPEHHIAEQAAPMKVAMGCLAVLAIVGGFLQIPGVTRELHHFLAPTFADSELYETLEPSASSEWIGLIIGAVIGLAGIGIAWTIYGKGGNAATFQARFKAARTSSSSTSGTSTRRSTSSSCGRPRGSGASPTAPSSACSSTARWWAAPRARSARCRPRCAASRRATCATTPPCCWSA